MSSIGPELPAHLSKRKRTPEDDGHGPSSPPHKQSRAGDASAKNQDEIALDDSEDDDDYGPQAPAPAKPAVGPTLPPSNHDEINLDSDVESETGPAPPAAASKEGNDDDSDDSDDSDDYGPALPGAANARKTPIGPSLPPSEPTPQRDSWMLAPPTSSSYAERDPTRIRSRKFASNPSASKSSGVSSIWTETPEEKLKRLQDTVLGRTDSTAEASSGGKRKTKEEEARERKIAANIEAQRGKSLYDEHQSRRRQAPGEEEEEDDPSKRGFDREKDMALGGKIGTSQRRELLNKAAGFGGRFQKGSYL
ncbi:hypothetical protein B0I35DRAFT_210588 [Stachybotrys elegans]|uniref:DUF3752 domain-containing protein n=1 Tax=Stachybotrys elegans TaxID=80388 RepID=A0A8K0SZX5_9HYPO|nr:hypothetical protein B0I35DRAFT_210588 [Stachybotrys elegans]